MTVPWFVVPLLVFNAIGVSCSLPPAFTQAPATWAFVSYQDPEIAVLPGTFNRSVFDSPWESETSDQTVAQSNEKFNGTDFIAYSAEFFDVIGPKASIEQLQNLPFQIHEAACYNPSTQDLFFVEWGPPGGENGTHSWQYLLNTKNNTLRRITTDPPTVNVHGCVFYNDAFYVVTDGSSNETGSINKIDPITLEKTVLLNNYYRQPFAGFNDIDADPDGNFYVTDGNYGKDNGLVGFTPPTPPTLYRVNGTTMRPSVIDATTTGNMNGVAFSTTDGSYGTIYVGDTGAAETSPEFRYNPLGSRGLMAYDISTQASVPSNKRLVNNPISYFYDGMQVSRNGWIFAAAGGGVDVIDPRTGLSLGQIRIGGGEYVAVNLALAEHELWIVGHGGVWHVRGIAEPLARSW